MQKCGHFRSILYMGIIEGWGTGLQRIQKSCQEYGLRKPTIEEFGNGFIVIFYRKGIGENQDIDSITESNTELECSSTEDRLLSLLCQQPEITQQEAADQLGYSKAWIRRIMKKLQQDGILRREGSTKKGLWIVLH